jgi:IS4 transposase
MARRKTIGIKKVLTRILPRRTLEKAADAVGLTQRKRKVQVHALFWALVLGFGAGGKRTIAGLRRAFERATDLELAPSAFYDRFTVALVRFLQHLVGYVLVQVSEPQRQLRGLLKDFHDVVMTDSTVIRLHDLLKRAFAACRTNHTLAALKLHTVLSVNGAGPRSIKITAERVHDGPVFHVGEWVRDRLLLFDLAYFRFQLFSRIHHHGGYFIVRLKKSANPLIVAANRKWRGQSVPIIGERVNTVLGRLMRKTLDVVVEVVFKQRVYAGIRHKGRAQFRLVAVRDPLTHEYHAYLTNIPTERLTPEEIAQIYAARWIIELFFRELKVRYRIDDIPSRKRVVVEALVYAALITFAVSRLLLATLRKKLGTLGARVPDERWAVLLAEVAEDVLRIVARRTADTQALARRVEWFLLREAVDPNANRALLRHRVELGIQYQHRVTVGESYA